MPSSTRRTRRLSDADVSDFTKPIIHVSSRIVTITSSAFVFAALYIIFFFLSKV